MHDSAMAIGRKFFETYLPGATGLSIVEVGAQDVNGSLRSLAPAGNTYTGVDFAEGPGVDVVLTDPYVLPFETGSVDVVLCSNCFEHSEFFWLTFLEIMRILKPAGLAFITVPANGAVHRYPVDCWRFYPDSGLALVRWSRRNGYRASLLEAFVGKQMEALINDFTAVYVQHEDFEARHRARITDTYDHYSWGFSRGRTKYTRVETVLEDWAARRLQVGLTNPAPPAP